MKRFLSILLIGIFLLGVVGCPPSKTDLGKSSTGAVLARQEMIDKTSPVFPMLGDVRYAVVRHDWVVAYYKQFRQELFDKDVVKWDERFDCNHFASYFVSSAQVRFYAENWGTSNPANTLAMGSYWYIKDSKTTLQGHALVMVITEFGVEYFEPQTGTYVTLSANEKLRSMLLVF